MCVAASSARPLSGSVASGIVSLNWGPSSGGCAATGYIVRAGAVPGLPNPVSLPVGGATSLQVAAPPGTYYVAVAAENAFGVSALSNEIPIRVGPSCTLPGAPTAFSAGSSGATATMSWAPPATGGAPLGYLLEAGSVSGAADVAVLPLAAVTFSTPAPPRTYFLRVKAQNACGVGPASAEQVLTMACATTGVTAPPKASVSGSTATITWNALSGATSYRVDVGTAAGASNVSSQVVAGTNRQLSGLSPGTYFMRVTAVNACGAGPASGEAMFAISPPPSTPSCGGVAAPLGATARCNDGWWSSSQNRSGTCSSHGGVSCWVCPGPLC
jgi:hypothetical protein